ncbi:hypothetical protein QUA27_23080 [Microcoleus sp. Pol14C6]|uniref:hypothetical protein n=1 Tax=unclassified Microcoleus TaxID=2642155 RepID=UPI002FCEEF4E
MKTSYREVRSHRAPQKKARSSATLNPTGTGASNGSISPGLASTGIHPKAIASSQKPEGAQLLKIYGGKSFTL